MYDGKDEVQIYDYVDVHVAKLDNMYARRVKGYAAIGYGAKCEGMIPVEGNIIFSSSNFLPVFSADLRAAKREIIIVSPYISQRRLPKMIGMLENCLQSGVKVSVVTRPVGDYTEKSAGITSSLLKLMNDSSIPVVEKSKIHQKFAIIDDRVVWYGSINLLGYGDAEESIMRVDSATIAAELISVMSDSN
jgi:phosphatidylserine/phosphatidylglycerophosphate/cardiolipin synthase-like enzyme